MPERHIRSECVGSAGVKGQGSQGSTGLWGAQCRGVMGSTAAAHREQMLK